MLTKRCNPIFFAIVASYGKTIDSRQETIDIFKMSKPSILSIVPSIVFQL